MKRSIVLYIKDILESIDLIKMYIEGLSKESLLKDKKIQDAVLRRLEIIGEASKSIPSTIKNKYCEIPWREIAGTRDILTHAYFSVNAERIWNIIRKDLPKLKTEIQKILKNEKEISE